MHTEILVSGIFRVFCCVQLKKKKNPQPTSTRCVWTSACSAVVVRSLARYTLLYNYLMKRNIHSIALHRTGRPLDAGLGQNSFAVFFFLLLPSSSHLSFLLLLPGRNSDPGSLMSRFFSPLPTTIRAFIFIARTLQPFLPSSTCTELRLT